LENEISIAIVGGGVVGCAIAWELSRGYDNVFLFEKNPGITRGENQSSRNSGVIHSGIYYDQETRPLKAALCLEGNRLLYDFCSRYKVPALQTGKIIVATNEEEEEILELYLNRARQNRVPGAKRISGEKVRELEPNVRARSALLVPTAGIVEPTTLVYRLHTLASQGGVHFMTGTEVTGIEKNGDFNRFSICYSDGLKDRIKARIMINAAGTDADLVSKSYDPSSSYELDPIIGESYKFYGHKRPELGLKGMNVYPMPQSVMTPHGLHFTVGIHLTPTFGELSFPLALGSTVTVGPKLVPIQDRNAVPGPFVDAKTFSEKVSPFFPGITQKDLIWHQAALQARLKGHPDFIIRAVSDSPNFINLLGIDSPGLTACLAIARRVKEMVGGMSWIL
jgi:L-2-hydroxyglutarate oxidase LhgO